MSWRESILETLPQLMDESLFMTMGSEEYKNAFQ